MNGIVIIVASSLFLLMGIGCCVAFNKLNNHTPFREVEYLEYLFTALGAVLVTPAAIFGIFAGISILINNGCN